VFAGLASPEAFLLGSQKATFFMCPHMAFFLCTYISAVSLCALISSFYKDNKQIELGPTLKASFYLNHLFKKAYLRGGWDFNI